MTEAFIVIVFAITGVRQYYKQLRYQPLPQKMFEQKCSSLIELLSSIDFDQCLVFSNYHLRSALWLYQKYHTHTAVYVLFSISVE